MNAPSFGGTLTGGIQDISALLPLLGTEQCEDHVSSALTKGYLYAAATPISIFGSLGMARAGFKTLVAGISSQGFIGARALTNMGFKPQGINLSLIMRAQDASSHYLVESRVESMLKDLHIDDARKVKPSMECAKWNTKMFLATTACCVLSIVPYIYLNIRPNMTSVVSRILFPIIKAVGGFLVATMMQLIIQNRILVIVKQSLTIKAINAGLKELSEPPEKAETSSSDGKGATDLESRLQILEKYLVERHSEHIHNASNNKTSQSTESGQWYFFKFANWCSRRKQSDSATPDTEKGEQIPACSLRMENPKSMTTSTPLNEPYKKLKESLVEAQKVGLTRFETIVCSALLLAGILASVAGYIGCFSVVQGSESHKDPVVWLVLECTLSVIRFVLWGCNPDGDDLPPFMLEFELNSPPLLPTCTKSAEDINEDSILPLVRAPEFLESITAYAGRLERFEHRNLVLYYALTRKLDYPHDRVLYIAIFDIAERTTRIYVNPTKNGGPTKNEGVFYSTADLEVDLEHASLQIKIGNRIDPNNDPVAWDTNIRSLLARHYQSILNQISDRERDQWTVDDIRNPWTFRFEDLKSKSPFPRNSDNAASRDEGLLQDELLYLGHGKIERLNRTLRKDRVEWIDGYMKLVDIDKKSNEVKQAWRRKVIEEEEEKLNETSERRLGVTRRRTVGGGGENSNALDDFDKKVEEVKELLTVAERWMMEVILFHEICGWEEKLSEGYKSLMRKFTKGKDNSTGRRLERMVGKSRLCNAWARLGEEKQAMQARWKDGLHRRLLDQSVNADYVNGLIDGTGPWNSAIELYTKESKESMEPQDLRTILKNFLHTSNIQGKARMNDGKWGEELVQDWCKEIQCRLEREVDEMDARLGRGLDCCHEFEGSYEYFHLIHGSSKWLDIPYGHIPSAGYLNTILKNFEHWRRDTLLIQFGWGNDDTLAELIPTICNMTSVTTVRLGIRTEFGDKACDALVDVISKNSSIISVIGHFKQTDAIKDALQRNIMSGIWPSISFESGIADGGDCLVFRTKFNEPRNCFTLRFLAPAKGDLKLRLRHSSSNIGVMLKVQEAVSFQYQVPIQCAVEYIRLSSIVHFEPREKTTLTFVLVHATHTRLYSLSDIQLLDDENNPYEAAKAYLSH